MLRAPSRGGGRRSKIDPKTDNPVLLNGRVGAYTYSDMTGFALSSVVLQ